MKKTTTLLLASFYLCGFAQESPELAKLKFDNGAIISMSNSTNNPNFIRFGEPAKLQLQSQNAKAKAAEFLSKHFKAFNLQSQDDIIFAEEKIDNYGLKTITYQQQYHGVPVYEGVLKFHFNNNEELTSINGNTISNIKTSADPSISAADAKSIAIKMVEDQHINASKKQLETPKTELLIFPKGLAQGDIVTNHLVYHIEVTNKTDVREFLFIDAHTGELVDQFTGIHPINRRLYETNTDSNNLKWKEGDAFPGTLSSWQQNEVVTSEHVYNFFKNAFNYISFNNQDATMITVNNDPTIDCPNARWNGVYAGYCDGTATDDVIAHEWGHAYTQYTSNLIYQYQSGALNESYSDVWGETIDLINNYEDEGENLTVRTNSNCSGSLRWKMGEDATAFGGSIRDMWNPNCNGDPSKVLDNVYYYCGTNDEGGVHTNSGVTNHLYALLVDGGTYNGYTMTGFGLVKAAHLWWKAQVSYLTPTSDFMNFADALEAAYSDLVGVNLPGLSTTTTPAGLSGQSFTASDLQNIKNGILAVQLRESPVTQCNYTPILNTTPDLCEAATNNPIFTENWENGIGNWTISNVPTNPSSWINRNWVVVNNLPKQRAGKAIFGADPINGNCSTSLQNGILRLESPQINFPTFSSGKFEMAVTHYIATENEYDGGNIKYSLNGGTWTIVPQNAFLYNPFNKALANSGNDNPLKGQRAFTGTDGGSLSGSWGKSVIDLSVLGVTSGSNIKFRFEMGTDGCNGLDGWYIDEITVYNCALLAVENIDKQSANVQVYPNPTTGSVTIKDVQNLNLKSAEIYSTSGQLIKVYKLNKTLSTLDLTQLPKGNYLLKIVSEKETSTVKLIKN